MKHFKEARDALPEQFDLLSQAAKSAVGILVFVPDTSALMDIVPDPSAPPAWDSLKASHPEVRVIMVPPVVKELDDHKRNRDERRQRIARAESASFNSDQRHGQTTSVAGEADRHPLSIVLGHGPHPIGWTVARDSGRDLDIPGEPQVHSRSCRGNSGA